MREHSLDPTQAELWITVSAEHVTPATELRGRLAGPRCLYAATVEKVLRLGGFGIPYFDVVEEAVLAADA